VVQKVNVNQSAALQKSELLLCHSSMYVAFYVTLVSNASQGKYLVPESSMWYVLAGLLLVLGISQATYVTLTTKPEVEAIEKSWKRRIDGWVFEQQYAIPKPLSSMDRGLAVEAM